MIPIGIKIIIKNGWRLPPDTVIVSNRSMFANPWKVSDRIDSLEAVIRYEEWMVRDLVPADTTYDEKVRLDIFRNHAWRKMPTLRGKNLACHCKIWAPCHRNVLLVLANPEIFEGHNYSHVYLREAHVRSDEGNSG